MAGEEAVIHNQVYRAAPYAPTKPSLEGEIWVRIRLWPGEVIRGTLLSW